jgi:hypothetical protein
MVKRVLYTTLTQEGHRCGRCDFSDMRNSLFLETAAILLSQDTEISLAREEQDLKECR